QLGQLFGNPRRGDGRGNEVVAELPGDGRCRHRRVVRGSDVVEGFEGDEGLVDLDIVAHSTPAHTAGGISPGAYVGQAAGSPGEEVEPILDDAVAGEGELRGDLPRLLQALEAEIRGTEVADLAGAHERIEGLGHGDLIDFVIVAVGVVDVDVVGAQATQGIVDAVADIRRVEASVLGVHADLRRDDHLVTVAAGLHPFADDRLGFAAGVSVDPGRVRIGCVDEVPAGLGVGVEDSEALIPIRAPAEGIASQVERV